MSSATYNTADPVVHNNTTSLGSTVDAAPITSSYTDPSYTQPSSTVYSEITPIATINTTAPTATFTDPSYTAPTVVPQSSTIDSHVPVQGGYATQTTTNVTTTTTTNKPPFGKRVENKSNEVVAKLKNVTGRLNAKMRARRGNKAQPGEKLETYVDPTPIQTGTPIGTAGH